MNERDPRVDPKPGDVISRSKYHPRSIEKVQNGEVRLYHGNHLHIWRMDYYRKWAATAEIVKRGDE